MRETNTSERSREPRNPKFTETLNERNKETANPESSEGSKRERERDKLLEN